MSLFAGLIANESMHVALSGKRVALLFANQRRPRARFSSPMGYYFLEKAGFQQQEATRNNHRS